MIEITVLITLVVLGGLIVLLVPKPHTKKTEKRMEEIVIKPSDEMIKQILKGEGGIFHPCFEWVNWGIEYLKLDEPLLESPQHGNEGFIKFTWVIYQACKQYSEDQEWNLDE